MIKRRNILSGLAGLAVGAALLLASAGYSTAAEGPSAAETLNALGPEMERVALGVGFWDVTETFWGAPGAEPVTTTGLVAERVMMGSLMQEVIRRPSDTAPGAVARTDLLTFNRLQGVWQYVSFDARFPAGLMPATGASTDAGAIDVVFEPMAFVLPGPRASGQLLRMEQIIRSESPDRDVKDQYFMPADGTGARWLAHRYAYRRHA